MAYGKPKIPVKEFRRLILDAIAERLDQNPMFQNDSLSFYRVDCDFSLKLTVLARDTDATIIKGNTTAGTAPEPERKGPEQSEPRSLTAHSDGVISKG